MNGAELPLHAAAPAARRPQHLRHLIALIIAAAIAGLAFAAYRQPDLMLGFSALRLC